MWAGLDRGDEGSGGKPAGVWLAGTDRCPMRWPVCGKTWWQVANHFFVFLQALVLLGQLWGHDGQDGESQGNKSRGIL